MFSNFKKVTLLLTLCIVGVPSVLAQGFPQPEDAIEAYVAGIKNQDFDAILAATAVDHMSKRLDFVGQVDRLQSLSIRSPLPPTSDLYVAMNRAEFVNDIAMAMKVFTFTLLSDGEMQIGETMRMKAEGAVTFSQTVDTTRLSGLSLIKIGIPEPTLVKSKVYQANASVRARTFGADDLVERVALLTFEGESFVLGFTLLRYQEGWSVLIPGSQVAGLIANPQRSTHEKFDMMID
jgi:hypothetical protein